MRWEYKTIKSAQMVFKGVQVLDAWTAELNAAGAQGWEVVGTLAVQEGQAHLATAVAVLKRLIQ